MKRRDALAALLGLPATATITTAEVKPEDVIVIECDYHVSPDQAERMKKAFEHILPGRKAVCLSKGAKLKVVSW